MSYRETIRKGLPLIIIVTAVGAIATYMLPLDNLVRATIHIPTINIPTHHDTLPAHNSNVGHHDPPHTNNGHHTGCTNGKGQGKYTNNCSV